ncbi:MAG: PBP1A family penicillin-binding protein [bacterium]
MATRRLSRPRHIRRTRRRLFPLAMAIFGATFLGLASTILWWSKDLPDSQSISDRSVVQSTKIFDRTGTHLLYEIGEVKRTRTALRDISPYIINATIATEDDQFYRHHGLDFFGIIRGVILKPLSGQRAQGGSTITQQLIKNSILTPERTFRRKAKEAVLALELEQRFTKDQILEMYLNEIPYGSQTYGVEAASQALFNQSASSVSLAQAAILAALPKAPTYYSPYGSHFEDLKRRQESILQRVADLDMVAPEEAEAAKLEALDFQPRAESISAPHFVFYIKEQLEEQYGQRIVEQGGLTVTTTLDMRLQTLAENTLSEHQDSLNSMDASNASLVAIDPKTGDILAMVGSIDYFNEEIDGNVNVAVRHRSPGSSIKPFIYAAAWQKGYTPDTILVDAETDFGQGYKPQNYDGRQHGPVTMRTALANSLNIPAVKTLYLAGIKNATDLAQQMGMTSLNDPDRYGLSLVLGGGEVRLLDEVSAYSAFANDGLRHSPQAILKVTDDSETIFDAAEEEPAPGQEVVSPQLARLVTNVISDNAARALTFGTRSYLQLGSRPVAAKTGTAQEYRDGWTLGYTPSLVAGVWVGNNDNSPMKKDAAGASTAAPIWHDFMQSALEGTPIEKFVDPEPLGSIPHGILRGELPEEKGKWEETAGLFYPSDCPVNLGQPTTFKELHSILFYVQRDNPLGPSPANAENDPQFKRWEEGIAAWRDKHNEKEKNNSAEPRYVDSLPTPICDATASDDLPKVTITEPNTSILKSSPVAVSVDIDSPRPLKEVRFMFDGKEIARRGPDDSFNASFSFDNNFSGRKTLLVLAVTENNLIGRAHRTFMINPDDSPPSITLHTPQNNLSLRAENFPLIVKVTAQDKSGIEAVDILYTKDGQPGASRIGRTTTTAPIALNRYEVSWADSPGPGTYTIYAIAYDNTGNSTTSIKHTITIE